MTTVEEMFDLIDTPSPRAETTWTTGNVAEAFPGVFTAFGISFVFAPMERAFRRMFRDLGVYTDADVHVPTQADDCFWAVFAGRGAGNIDMFREIANVMPGTSATAVEKQLFGYARPETVDANSMKRLPAILVRAPRWLIGVPKRHDAMFAELRRWRLEQLPRIPDLDEAGCLAVLADARARFEEIMSIHMGVAMISSSFADKVAEAAAAVGFDGLEAQLLSGVGSDENEVAHDLWALAHGEIAMPEFSDRHGYHGPGEGQLHGSVWREDPSPILARLGDYRAIEPGSPRSPKARSAAQVAVRAEAITTLLAATPRLRRRPTAFLLRTASRFLALREQGKAGYLLTFDVARAAARRLGELLVEADVIAERDDVFHLRHDQVVAGVRTDQRVLVARRTQELRTRQELRLPMSWSGVPDVVKAGDGAGAAAQVGDVVTGVAASGGVVEGRARVVRDPAEVELDDGDILVCETTDPSWVSLFLVAGGVVTDHGGLLSHGPIVARELGIPCVCGTETGSHRIQDGQLLRLDGDKGTVEVLA
ncbi:PEP-utilizing enzyme [Nocardioides sp. Root190]|uniref:PEP-utilizing enzyme n=1 Tax=Nocardioides sp. Root190 TaxID=1736488 RepID=UPI000A987622|nr:PEP-utilizing enzyme [Nocardioides sp. Root190]